MSTIPKRAGWVRLATEAIRAICCKRCWRWNRRANRCWESRLRKPFCVSPLPQEKRVISETNASRKNRRCGNGKHRALGQPPKDVNTFMWEIEGVIFLHFCESVRSRDVALKCAFNTIGGWTCEWIKPRRPCQQERVGMEATGAPNKNRSAISFMRSETGPRWANKRCSWMAITSGRDERRSCVSVGERCDCGHPMEKRAKTSCRWWSRWSEPGNPSLPRGSKPWNGC